MNFQVQVIKTPIGVAFKIGATERRKPTKEEVTELVSNLRTMCNDLERRGYETNMPEHGSFLEFLADMIKEAANTPPHVLIGVHQLIPMPTIETTDHLLN